MEIGRKLRQARTQAGLTQAQAAEKILVSRQTVSNWETGKVLPGPAQHRPVQRALWGVPGCLAERR